MSWILSAMLVKLGPYLFLIFSEHRIKNKMEVYCLIIIIIITLRVYL